MSELERFLAKVEKGDCWVWTGSRVPRGYGRLRLSSPRRMVYAHRWAYEWFIGPIPEGMEIDHLCRNPSCVNPDHLEAVTHRENVHRGEAGRNNRDKTHCPKGHRYDEENTAPRVGGGRRCRACLREGDRRRYAASA